MINFHQLQTPEDIAVQILLEQRAKSSKSPIPKNILTHHIIGTMETMRQCGGNGNPLTHLANCEETGYFLLPMTIPEGLKFILENIARGNHDDVLTKQLVALIDYSDLLAALDSYIEEAAFKDRIRQDAKEEAIENMKYEREIAETERALEREEQRQASANWGNFV